MPLLLLLLALQTAMASPAPSADEADALYTQAAELAAAGQVSEAVPLLERSTAIDAALGAGRRQQLARGWTSLGLCLSALGRSEEAVERLAAALAVWREEGARLETIAGLERLGLVEFAHSKLAEAREHLEEAVRLAELDAPHALPGLLGNLGMVCQAQGRDEEALAHYRTVLDLPAIDARTRASALGNLANLHLVAGRLGEAEAAYREAQAAFEALGLSAAVTSTTVNLGMVFMAQGQYERARSAFEHGLAAARRDGQPLVEASARLHLARVFEAIGLYDQAEAAYAESLRLFETLDQPQNAAAASTGLGSLYLAWGRPDRALAIGEQALALAERHALEDQVIGSLELIARAQRTSGRVNTAVLHYERALAIARRLTRNADEGRLASALGLAFLAWHKPRQAEPYLREAVAVAERLGQAHAMAQGWIHLGALHDVAGEPGPARQAYLRGLELARTAGAKPDQASALNNLGALALRQGDHREAESRLLGAIELVEGFRLTAAGDDRQSSLAPWLSSYRWLIHLRFLQGDASAAFEASERVKARYLAERMMARASVPDHGGPPIDAFRRDLAPGVAVVSFANIDWQHPIAIVATRDAIRMYAVDVARAPAGEEDPAVLPGTMRRGAVLGRWLEDYRGLLAERPAGSKARARREALGRRLFDALLAPAEDLLAGARELVVIPDGGLSLVPLETLRLPDGRYLVERHHVIYAPSLRVLRLLRERRARSSHPRSLFAMGGAPHAAPGARRSATASPGQLEALRAALRRRLAGEGAADVYAALGASWPDLPGARSEVEALSRLVPGSLVLSGAEVTEATLKRLSREGVLRQFETLHFATHGLTIPDAPELSALVLAEAGRDEPGEDGYLSVPEIAELDLQPEFVNLSACESGLGRIYGGEGAVGLTQAFLDAGANGVSVSLWRVQDSATRDFMVDLYTRIRRQGRSPAEAMTEAKRSFLRSGRREPFLWAAFVYYGG